MTDIITQKQATLSRQVMQGKKMTLKTLNKKDALARVRDVYVVCDISGSMDGDKLDNLKKALKTVIRPGIRMLAFSSEVFEIKETDIGDLYAMDRTAMLLALRETWSFSPRHIILLTDGQPDDPEQDILAQALMHKDTPIDTIGISSGGHRSYNPDFLRELSRITGGKFTDVGKPVELTCVIQNLLLEASTSRDAIQL